MILVTGDVVLDHNLYAGQRSTPDSAAALGMLHRTHPGGALLTHGLLEAMERSIVTATIGGKAPPSDLFFGLKETTAESLLAWPSHFKVGAVWDAFDGPKEGSTSLGTF